MGAGLTGIVLAGGASRRMGRDKAFLDLDGRPLIEVVIERIAQVCAEVLVVAGDARPYAGLGVPVVEDRFRGVGVLGGLHAGLEAAVVGAATEPPVFAAAPSKTASHGPSLHTTASSVTAEPGQPAAHGSRWNIQCLSRRGNEGRSNKKP